MTVSPTARLLVVTDDSFFTEYTLAAVDRYPDVSVTCVSTLSAARTKLSTKAVDCVVLDTDLSEDGIRRLHGTIRAERSQLPVVLTSDRSRSALFDPCSYHAFVRKQGPAMGISLANVVRVLTADMLADRGTVSATAE